MRIVLFFDQIQSGTGGKEGANVGTCTGKRWNGFIHDVF